MQNNHHQPTIKKFTIGCFLSLFYHKIRYTKKICLTFQTFIKCISKIIFKLWATMLFFNAENVSECTFVGENSLFFVQSKHCLLFMHLKKVYSRGLL